MLSVRLNVTGGVNEVLAGTEIDRGPGTEIEGRRSNQPISISGSGIAQNPACWFLKADVTVMVRIHTSLAEP